jgi:hypothetical protein
VILGTVGAAIGTTVTFALPETPVNVAVTLTEPALKAAATPWVSWRFDIVAIELSETVQVTLAVRSRVLPSPKVPVALNCFVVPTLRVALEGDTATENTGGDESTVKLSPLLTTPETATVTFPLVAPDGTVTVTLVELQLAGIAVVPLNVTALDASVGPKFVPVIVTGVPIIPEVIDRLAITGAGDPDPGALIDTLSKVAVARLELDPLLTARPMYTFCAIVNV